jgi:hypothetical protein
MLSLLVIAMFLVGCTPTPEISDAELENELSEFSEEELDATIKAAEAEDSVAIVGQAYYRGNVPKEQLLRVANKVKENAKISDLPKKSETIIVTCPEQVMIGVIGNSGGLNNGEQQIIYSKVYDSFESPEWEWADYEVYEFISRKYIDLTNAIMCSYEKPTGHVGLPESIGAYLEDLNFESCVEAEEYNKFVCQT